MPWFLDSYFDLSMYSDTSFYRLKEKVVMKEINRTFEDVFTVPLCIKYTEPSVYYTKPRNSERNKKSCSLTYGRTSIKINKYKKEYLSLEPTRG